MPRFTRDHRGRVRFCVVPSVRADISPSGGIHLYQRHGRNGETRTQTVYERVVHNPVALRNLLAARDFQLGGSNA